MKKLIHKESETKFYDYVPFAGTGIGNGGTFAVLTNPAQGNTDQTRVGDKLTMRGMRISWTAVPGDDYNVMRMIVFQWYPNTALTVPATNLIIENPTYPTISAIRHDYNGNTFKVLKDFKFTMVLPAASPVGTTSSVRTGTFKVPFKWVKKSVEYTSGTTNAAHNIYVFVVTDSAAPPNPSITLYSRLWFDDS